MERLRLDTHTLTQIPPTGQGRPLHRDTQKLPGGGDSYSGTSRAWVREVRAGEGRAGELVTPRLGLQHYITHPHCVPSTHPAVGPRVRLWFLPCSDTPLASQGAGYLPFGFCSLCDSFVRKQEGSRALNFRVSADHPGSLLERQISTHTPPHCSGLCRGSGIASRGI